MPSAKTQEIANIFYEIADILELKQVPWKPIAYRKAARALETMGEDVESVYKRGGVKAFMEIPGIGERLAKKIVEYLETGKVREYERVKRLIPSGVEEMMHVASLGPKKAMRLYKELHIKSISELEAAAKAGKIRALKGFGQKSEQDILRGLSFLQLRKARPLLGTALPIARDIEARLRKVKGVKVAQAAGSVRRMKETVGDIDILVIAVDSKPVMDFFTSMPDVAAVLAKGPTKSTVMLKQGIQADVRVLEERSFGAALQYFTGSKDHNIALRKIAIQKGYKLSEYGLFRRSGAYVAGRTEQDVYRALGLPYIEPELRENWGEIEAAQAGRLPKLIALGDIKGDLHVHTKWDGGAHTIEEMAAAIQKMKYQYFLVADHSKSQKISKGLDERRLLKQIAEIDRLNKKFDGFRIFKGIEVDILPSGKLDLSDAVLKQLDLVIASVHSRFKSSREEMTARICTALENPHVDILGHPTGRLINERPPYALDMEKVFDVAKASDKILEIDAFPNRLDLNDINIKAAKAVGLKFSIGTDSHSRDHLRVMEFGVAHARRGWLEARDVINAMPLKKFEKFVDSRR
ncbi:MAG: DNA polymerase/3'-5' exonuclease PolX [Candidatus Aenigmatarchaeota archaeon]